MISVTVARLIEFVGTIRAISQQELGRDVFRDPSPSAEDSAAAIMLLMALEGSTGDGIQTWLHDQPEAIAHRTPTPRPPLPPVPTRAQVCGVQLTFQGLTVETEQFGRVNWFEPWLQALTTADRQAVYAAKRAAGDTHAIVEFLRGGPIYDEPPFDRFVSPDYETDPELFRALIEEILRAGFTPIVAFDGDDGDGLERGHANALRQLPILVDLFGADVDLNPYILYARLWDGVFYGSSPANIATFGRAFRVLLPDGYLGLEHNPGHLPVGNGPSDWRDNGAMTTYDVLFHEFVNWPARGDQLWQIAARVLGPAYQRPSDQPSSDDPHPPYYFAQGSPRGPYFPIAFEFAEYQWVRSQISNDDVQQARAYLRALGYTHMG